MKELIKKLSDMRGVSGFEYRLSDKIKELFSAYSDEVYTDKLGNVIAVKRCGKPCAKKVMIEAHCDEIGLMVKDIDKNGFITFVCIGGVDTRILPALEVIVHGKRDILGIIGAKPPHLQSAEEGKKSVKIEDMAIDVGLDYDEVIELVSIGDSITLPQSVGDLGGQFSGKSLDDRASIAALIAVFKNLQKVKLDVDVYATVAVQEEIGSRGAKTASYAIEPDIAVAVDVCHAITPDNSYNAFELGSGCIISVGPNIHPKLQKRLSKTAKDYNIKTALDVAGGSTGTDGWAIQVSRNGIPTAVLSIPLKYMHTCVETLMISDVEAVASLLTFFIQNLDENLEEWLCY
ncbi:MAG: M42 family metallopeptidase [Clostridia bacterium]|nr:M42 family metallopeptidase [Clostridia bacterium]